MTAAAFHLEIDWHQYRTPLKVEVVCLILAILIHIPLYFIKVDARKKARDFGKARLSEVVMIDQIEEKKDIPVPAPVAPKRASATAPAKTGGSAKTVGGRPQTDCAATEAGYAKAC